MRQTKVLHIFEMLIICAMGLSLILYPRKSWDTAMTILGIALLSAGVIAAGYYFLILRRRDPDNRQAMIIAVAGVIAIVLGSVVVFAPNVFTQLFRFIAGVLVAFSGILNLVKALEVRKQQGRGWKVLLALSLLTIALGVLIYVNPFKVQAALVILVGAVLIYNGVLGIITAIQE